MQAQSHCCASAQQSHLSFRSNLTAAQLQSHFAPHGAKLKISCTRGRTPAEFDSPPWGRNSIGRWSSVHAVRARPLLHQKNNIEPDEQREEADTFPTRGVNPESRPAPGSRPALCSSRYAPRARVTFFPCAGAYAPAYIISPHKGAIKFGGHLPAGTIFFYFAPAGRSEIAAYAAVRFERMLK